MALTGRKALFVEAKMAGMSNTNAAIHAGYSEKTAPQAGSRLAKDPDVIAAVPRAKLMQKVKASKPYKSAIEKVVKTAKKSAAAAAEERKEPEPETVTVTINEEKPVLLTSDPLEFMARLMNDASLDERLRLDAAKALAAYKYAKPGEMGKKEQKDEQAKKVANKFAQILPPKLVSVGGRK